MDMKSGAEKPRAALVDELRRLELEVQQLESVVWDAVRDCGVNTTPEDSFCASMATVAFALISGFLVLNDRDATAADEFADNTRSALDSIGVELVERGGCDAPPEAFSPTVAICRHALVRLIEAAECTLEGFRRISADELEERISRALRLDDRADTAEVSE